MQRRSSARLLTWEEARRGKSQPAVKRVLLDGEEDHEDEEQKAGQEEGKVAGLQRQWVDGVGPEFQPQHSPTLHPRPRRTCAPIGGAIYLAPPRKNTAPANFGPEPMVDFGNIPVPPPPEKFISPSHLPFNLIYKIASEVMERHKRARSQGPIVQAPIQIPSQVRPSQNQKPSRTGAIRVDHICNCAQGHCSTKQCICVKLRCACGQLCMCRRKNKPC